MEAAETKLMLIIIIIITDSNINGKHSCFAAAQTMIVTIPQSCIILFPDTQKALWLKEEQSWIGKGPKIYLLSYRLMYLYLQAFNQTNWIKTASTYATDFGWKTCLARSKARH